MCTGQRAGLPVRDPADRGVPPADRPLRLLRHQVLQLQAEGGQSSQSQPDCQKEVIKRKEEITVARVGRFVKL